MKTSNIWLAALATLLISQGAAADDLLAETPTPDHCKELAKFAEKYPAVAVVYCLSNVEDVLSFYQQQLGDSTSQTQIGDRITLHYVVDSHPLRVAVSPQSQGVQIDLMLQEQP